MSMSDILIESGKRAKREGCDVVLNICEPLHDILFDLQNPVALSVLGIIHGDEDSSRSVQERLSGNVKVFLRTYVRRLFPKQKDNTRMCCVCADGVKSASASRIFFFFAERIQKW
jgi:hypothetical protein